MSNDLGLSNDVRKTGRGRRLVRVGPPCRKFSLMDGMILIGGLTVGFAGLRIEFETFEWANWTSSLNPIGGFTLMLLSALVLVFRLRRPRPKVRRIACQPGAVACFAAVAFGLIVDLQHLLQMAIGFKRSPVSTFIGWVWWTFEAPGPEIALIVSISWVLMLLARRWQPEPGWIDRSGTIVGWGWIVWGLAFPFLP